MDVMLMEISDPVNTSLNGWRVTDEIDGYSMAVSYPGENIDIQGEQDDDGKIVSLNVKNLSGAEVDITSDSAGVRSGTVKDSTGVVVGTITDETENGEQILYINYTNGEREPF